MPDILQSFTLAIPDAPLRDAKKGIPSAHISGASTEAADPPKFAFEVPLGSWDPFSKKILDNKEVQQYLRKCQLASWEPSRYLCSEGDVGDAAAVQLMNPVDLAFAARHPNEIKSLSQETTNRSRSRADKTWSRLVRKGVWRSFAVVEYKKTGVIDPKEMKTACINPKDFNKKAGRPETEFRGNSFVLLKQAVHYAESYETKYIAFFDWDTLVLLYLGNHEDTSGGIWCCLTQTQDKAKMRGALLSFLERAYLSSVNGESSLPTIVPPHS